MKITIPPEFETFAREQVATGAFASTEEVVSTALRSFLRRAAELQALIDEGLRSGDLLDGGSSMKEFLAETELLAARMASDRSTPS